jgi:hypothetical protein
MVAGELVALLATVTVPVAFPGAVGSKLKLRFAVCPGVRIVPPDTPLPLKPAPEILTLEIVTLELPAFENVTGRVLLTPVFTLPKLKLAGLALSR